MPAPRAIAPAMWPHRPQVSEPPSDGRPGPIVVGPRGSPSGSVLDCAMPRLRRGRRQGRRLACQTDDGSAIRRRRECLACGHRFTTFERVEEVPLVVVKRSGRPGALRPVPRSRPASGPPPRAVRSTTGGSPSWPARSRTTCRLEGAEVTSEQVGLAVLDRLREVDEVAYVRFASVYKDFDDAADFQRELRLLTKDTEPKRH